MQVFQRQLSKEGLQQVVNNSTGKGEEDAEAASISTAAMSTEELRDLFTLRQHTASDTFDSMCNDDDDEAADMDVDIDAPITPPEVNKEQV